MSEDNKLAIPTDKAKLAMPRRKLSIQDRLRQAQTEAKQRSENADKLPNRILILSDCSGSMSGRSMDALKEAVGGFVDNCNFNNTAVALATFGLGDGVTDEKTTTLLVDSTQLKSHVEQYEASGGTPMKAAIENAIGETRFATVPMTRTVLVSDGEATDVYSTSDNSVPGDWRFIPTDYAGRQQSDSWWDTRFLLPYVQRNIPIDTVHIGGSKSGEAFLKWIAHKTNGVYLKFRDVSQFATSFKYLTPAYYGLLTSGNLAVDGADEVRR